jgi:protein-S-isoprenylcysteine O-methyltransferase Ste14
LIMYLLLGHLLGDFALQSDHMAQKKNNSKKTLSIHVAVYTLIIASVLLLHSLVTRAGYFFSWTVLLLLILLFLAHWGQDYLKGHVFAKTKQIYYLDQILHLSLLYVLRLLVY